MLYARKKLIKTFNPSCLTLPLEDVARFSCEFSCTTVDEMRNRCKETGIAYKRTTVFATTLVLADASIVDIAKYFDRDSSTVLGSAQNLVMRLRVDQTLKRRITYSVRHVAASCGKGVSRPPPKVQGPAQLISFPNVEIPEFSPGRRECHKANVAYASALYKAHGDGARWPEIEKC